MLESKGLYKIIGDCCKPPALYIYYWKREKGCVEEGVKMVKPFYGYIREAWKRPRENEGDACAATGEISEVEERTRNRSD